MALATNGPKINGSEASAVYQLHQPNTIWIGKTGGDLEETPVPEEFLKPAGSPRSVDTPDPAIVFRYDMVWEFCSAIVEGRGAEPSFLRGLGGADRGGCRSSIERRRALDRRADARPAVSPGGPEPRWP